MSSSSHGRPGGMSLTPLAELDSHFLLPSLAAPLRQSWRASDCMRFRHVRSGDLSVLSFDRFFVTCVMKFSSRR